MNRSTVTVMMATVKANLLIIWLLIIFTTGFVIPANIYADKTDVNIKKTGTLSVSDMFNDTDHNSKKVIWSAGDKNGVYLIIARQKQKQEGFQIYYRPLTQATFLPGQWYPGKPLDAAVADGKLQVFLRNGGAQSYTINGDDRTEPRLGQGLRLLSCCSWNDKLYTLVTTTDTVELKYTPLIDNNTTGTDTNADTNTNTVSRPVLLPGKCAVLQRGRNGQWRSITKKAIDISKWDMTTCSLAVNDKEIYIFGIRDKQLWQYKTTISQQIINNQSNQSNQSNQPNQPNSLTSQPYQVTSLLKPELAIKNVVAVKALQINQQLCVITATANRTALRFCVGQDNGRGGYTFSNNLERNHLALDNAGKKNVANKNSTKNTSDTNNSHTGNTIVKNSIFTARPGRYSFAIFGENIAAFAYRSDNKVLYSLYSTGGTLLEPGTQSIKALEQSPNILIAIFFSQGLVTVLVLIMILVVFSAHKGAFGEGKILSEGIQIASFWRRLQSFIIDIIIINILTQIFVALFFPGLIDTLNTMPELDTVLKQIQTGTVNAQLLQALVITYLIFYGVMVVYYTLWELFFSATPGKMAMRIKVATPKADKPIARAIIIRNLMRLIEFHPQIIMFSVFLVILTRYSQRAGDLAASTIVIKKSKPSDNHTPATE